MLDPGARFDRKAPENLRFLVRPPSPHSSSIPAFSLCEVVAERPGRKQNTWNLQAGLVCIEAPNMFRQPLKLERPCCMWSYLMWALHAVWKLMRARRELDIAMAGRGAGRGRVGARERGLPAIPNKLRIDKHRRATNKHKQMVAMSSIGAGRVYTTARQPQNLWLSGGGGVYFPGP